MLRSCVVRTLAAILLLVAAVSLSLYAQSPEEYRNSKYGFCVSLSASWKGYSIVVDHWQGHNPNGANAAQIVQKGPLILIRHPLWTKENPRQDVPVMVFTRRQWASLEKDEFHIGAAPIGPNELGRNRKYVFAAPARYDFTELTGVDEVRQIINGKSLHAPCKNRE